MDIRGRSTCALCNVTRVVWQINPEPVPGMILTVGGHITLCAVLNVWFSSHTYILPQYIAALLQWVCHIFVGIAGIVGLDDTLYPSVCDNACWSTITNAIGNKLGD